MAYLATCPNCGKDLHAIALAGAHPPWGCTDCARGWWEAELEERDLWDPATRSFPAAIRAEAYTEQAVAAIRGTSITPASLHAVDAATLDRLATSGRAGDALRVMALDERNRRKP